MFTLAVIVFDVIVLIWAGLKILKRSKEVTYLVGKYLAWGLFLSAFGIFMYGVRSIILQFQPLETMVKIDEIVYRIGVPVHFIGCTFLVWFVYKGFAPKLFTKITAPFVLGLLLLVSLGAVSFPLLAKIHQAPLEPIRFMMTSRPWAWGWMNLEFVYASFIGSAVVFGIFLYNVLAMENKKKALFFGILTPILIHFGIAAISRPGTFLLSKNMCWMLMIIGLILLISVVFLSKNKRRLGKAIMYGFGTSLLISAAVPCVFISPVFARIGYGIGAILTYKAFGMKVE